MIGINEIGTATSSLKDSEVNTLLKEVMNTIRSTVRVDDYIIRWGEAEFLVVLHYTHLSNSGIVAEKIRKAIEYRSFTKHKKRITITICATAKNEESGIQEAIDRAVEAMSTASTQNKNRVIFP